jgi:hypothetical protein
MVAVSTITRATNLANVSMTNEKSFNIEMDNQGNDDFYSLKSKKPPALLVRSNTSTARKVCPNALSLFNGMEDIEVAYKASEEFHRYGGNLKTLENFLNDQIDPTFKVHDIKFHDKAAEKDFPPEQSIKQGVQDLLKAQDTKGRGGYDQPFLPGWFDKAPPGTLEAQRFRARGRLQGGVHEPTVRGDRWTTAFGPIGPLCKSLDQIRTNKGWEDKYFCSFYDIVGSIRTTKDTVDKDAVDDKVSVDKEGSDKIIDDDCHIISIGGNGEWGFEKVAVVGSNQCKTHTFDCTVKNPKKPANDNINFYPHCIAAEDKDIDGRSYLSYSSIIKKAGLENSPPKALKMDVEGFEFDVLTAMLRDAAKKSTQHFLPSQISIEVHYGTRMYDLPWMLRFRQTGELALFFNMMYQSGYLVVFSDINTEKDKNYPGSVTEIVLVRVFCDEM